MDDWIAQEISNTLKCIVDKCKPLYEVFVPTVTRDGNKWCALYGENIQEGIVGFGDSPAEALGAYGNAWYEKIKEAQ